MLPNTVPTEAAIVPPLTRRLIERCCIASWTFAATTPFLLLFGEWKLALATIAVATAMFALHRRFPVEPD